MEETAPNRFHLRLNVNRLISMAVMAVLAWQILAALLNIHYGIDSLNMISVFESDEAAAVLRLKQNIEEGDLSPNGMFQYGMLHSSLAFLMAKPLLMMGYSRGMEASFLALSLRLVSVLSFILLIFSFYGLSRLFLDSEGWAWIAVLLLASIPNLYYWAQIIHPDIPQTALIVLSVYVAFRKQTFRQALWASFIAGMAFGTKFGGIFIWPFLIMPALLLDEPDLTYRQKLRKHGGRFMGAFLLGWLLFNPYVIFNFIHFIGFVKTTVIYLATGFYGSYGRTEPANPLLWFPTLKGALTATNAFLVTSGLLVFALRMYRILRNRQTVPDAYRVNLAVLTVYCVLAALHVLVGVKSREVRYTFHFLPFLVLLTCIGLERLATVPARPFLKQAALVLLFLLILPGNINAVKDMSFCSNKGQDVRLTSGPILEEGFRPDVRILADFYAYIPPRFKNTRIEWGINLDQVRMEDPDVIMIARSMSGRYAWKRPGTTFAECLWITDPSFPPEQVRIRQDLYEYLCDPDVSPYRVAFEDEQTVILQKWTGPRTDRERTDGGTP